MASSSSSSSPPSRFTSSLKLSLRKQISIAIRENSCPICLSHINDRRAAILSVCMHAYCIDCIKKWSQLKRTCPLCNAQFRSWFIKSRASSSFEKVQLPKFDPNNNRVFHIRDDDRLDRRRFSSNYRRERRLTSEVVRNVSNQSRELPVRRSFGYGGYDGSVLQWRASIYREGLRAVPFPSKNVQGQDRLANRIKERIKQRIEPWIKRELEAILQDPDPTVIVHLATSLYILSLEEKLKSSRECPAVEETFVQQLRRFLLDQTDMFWHELRCYAESSFEMTTYDTLVEYRHPSQ
ncbi:RING-type E3 ubiquitin transferase [Ranunculus cassubicifolius]